MTQQQLPLEQMIAGWMADEAAGAPEQVLERILATTAKTAPRPRIVALVAEPTLRTRTTRAAVGLPGRRLVLIAVLALLLAAVAGLGIGAYLLLNQAPPHETADWQGFLGSADHRSRAVEGPKGNPVASWQFHARGGVLEVALVGDRAFFASDDGTLYAVTRDGGVEVWAVHAGQAPLSGPFAADGRLYLSDANGTIHAFTQADGSAVWTSAGSYATPSRAISSGGIVAFGTSDGVVVALDAATGTERWRVQLPASQELGAPAFADGRLYVGTGIAYVALDAATGRTLWSADTHGEHTGSALVADGIAYIGAFQDPTGLGTLHAFDAATGRPLWDATAPHHGIGTVVDGVIYSPSNLGELAAIDTGTGATRWTLQVGGDVKIPVVVDGVVYVSAADHRRIYALEAITGDELWHFDLDGPANCCIAVAKGSIVVGTLSGSVYRIGGDGATLTARPFATATTSPVPTPAASASVGPSQTPLPNVGAVAWTADLRSHDVAPACQIAVDPATGRIWVPEANGGRFAILGPDGKLLEEWGEPGTDRGQFDFSRGNGDGYGTVAFAKDGSFFVLDVGNERIQKFDRHRRFVTAWGQFGTGPGEYVDPVGIAVAPDGTLWVLDDRRSIVEHYTADGEVIGSFDPFERHPVNNGANSLAIDSDGNLYVSGAGPNIVSVFDATGTFLREVGQGAFSEQAGQMAIDREGRLYVTQGPNRGDAPAVLVFGLDGSVIGGFGPLGPGDGQVIFPAGVALDGMGGMIVGDGLPETARLMKVRLEPPFAP